MINMVVINRDEINTDLYRVESDLGTFLVNKDMRMYDASKEGKSLYHYSTQKSVYQWLWIAIDNATIEFECSVDEVISALNWRITKYPAMISMDDVVISSTFNGNTKEEIVSDTPLLASETIYIKRVEELPGWSECFPSDWDR